MSVATVVTNHQLSVKTVKGLKRAACKILVVGLGPGVRELKGKLKLSIRASNGALKW